MLKTYDAIKHFGGLNEVDEKKVQAIMDSLLANGWKGAPLLYVEGHGLVTGSHRLEALKRLDRMAEKADDELFNRIDAILSAPIALDVTGIVNDYCARNDCTFDDIDFSDLSEVFEGTEVEQYADEIEEW